MRRFERLLLFVVAIVVGGLLGYKLLSSSGPFIYLLFLVACMLLGTVFYRIDKWICEHHKK